MTSRIEQRASFDLIRYANCWEDADILCEALQPAPGKRILAIASAGDNAFALLAGGAQVVAADLSTAQLACVALKASAIAALDREPLLAFLGLRPDKNRLATFARLAPTLPADARAYWEAHRGQIRRGLIHAGKFERYFRLFRTGILPLVHRRSTITSLLQERSAAARSDFFLHHWNTWRWRLLFRLFFSRAAMGRLGRDPEFFRYVEGSVADRILGRVRYALTALPTHDNPYLDYILTGNFTRAVPAYLRPEILPKVRANLGNLTCFAGGIDAAIATHGTGGFDGFNLSDIFEYMDEATTQQVYATLLGAANPRARFAYWNMLAPRRCPEVLAPHITRLDTLAMKLFARDRAFFYSAFIVEEVRGVSPA